MRDDLANTSETAGDPVIEEAYRRERRLFWRTCMWVGAALASYLGGMALNFGYRSEIRRWRVSRTIGGFEEIQNGYLPWFATSQIALLASLIGFLVCLVCWIRAMHTRRKVEARTISVRDR